MKFRNLTLPSSLLLTVVITFTGAFKLSEPVPMFRLVPASSSGINFTNTISEDDTLNILNHANIYNGGGVGVGDFNNDGLPDLYFAGNMVSSKLYLNKGDLHFDDVTDVAGAGAEGRWCTGVSVVDINGDGLLDIYLAASFTKDIKKRTNLLYINLGNNSNGIPQFRESAKAYGIADTGYSTQGYFFDYDRDGDLDLYLVTNALNDPKTPIRYRPKVTDGSAINNDRLYRNNGNGTFANVSRQAGILIEGWGHAAAISDFNNDGWPDIYVANDFISNDLLYINNRNGTFTNRLGEYFKHTSWNAMGTDAVDINNDGFVDLVSLEMLPEKNLRKKRMLGGNEYYNYFNNQKFNYDHQYVRNTFQVNSGPTPLGHPVFSDQGYMAGIYQTDWSWCPLVADFDNDGLRDIIISNGLPRDVTDLDYIAYGNKQGGQGGPLTLDKANSLPIVNLPNYAFKNKGNAGFTDVSTDWGLTQNSFSNGGAWSDLDNDGDLDFVINNINTTSFLYENTLNSVTRKGNRKSVSVRLEGRAPNTRGIGARIYLYTSPGKVQYYEHQPSRGYLSSVDDRAHFGVDEAAEIDSMRVIWPDNKSQLLLKPSLNQTITVAYKNAGQVFQQSVQGLSLSLMMPAAAITNLKYKPEEKDFIDYNIQSTLPHKLSQYGPGIAVGDIDNNGYEDFYLGGASEKKRVFFMQDASGKFTIDSLRFGPNTSMLEEDMGALLFDADNDNDLDLYVVTGSYEIPPNHKAMQDRLYLNNGKGRFTKAAGALPAELSNGSCVRAADIDGDGLLDLFVGGRVVSGAYPSAPKSFILKNTGGSFIDVTSTYLPALEKIGMITDALFTDFDNDGRTDLLLVGEWMAPLFFRNDGKAFTAATGTGLEDKLGWWNSLAAADFDQDGDIDYVAGNLGLNTNYVATDAEPMMIYAKDFDENGSFDAFTFCNMLSEDGDKKSFPMHARDDMITQMISVRKKFPTYTSYGLATVNDLLSPADQASALSLKANHMQSSYIENLGNGKFNIKPLPVAAQAAPVFGMICRDINGDGTTDIIMIGNDYSMEPYSGRHDAFNGLCLAGDGKGGFTPLSVAETGFFVPGDAKGLAAIVSANKQELLIATQNQGTLLGFNNRKQAKGNWIQLKTGDFSADITYKSNRKSKVEFYHGSGFLSQSGRKFFINDDVISLVIMNYNGTKRVVK